MLAQLDIRGLVARYSDTTVLDGIDLSVDRGEIVSLVGPSGSEKSTLLRVTPGFCRLARERRAIVFEQYSLFGNMTVLRNVIAAPLPIKRLAVDLMTLLIVSHEISFVRNVSNRVIFMADGKVQETRSPAQIFDAPRMPRTQTFVSRLLPSSHIATVPRISLLWILVPVSCHRISWPTGSDNVPRPDSHQGSPESRTCPSGRQRSRSEPRASHPSCEALPAKARSDELLPA